LKRGNEWLAKGEWDRAIADYDLAIVFDARVAVAFYNRGLARHRKGDLAGALSDYGHAIDLNPRYADAYLNRGSVYAGRGQYDAAIGDFSKAIEINPHDARAWNNRGKALAEQARFAHAVADLIGPSSSTRAMLTSGATAAARIIVRARWTPRSMIAIVRSSSMGAVHQTGTIAAWRGS